ncbi:MAG: Gfo/Idh/MocA family oxidoreductase [Fimbriimonadia bacterium]
MASKRERGLTRRDFLRTAVAAGAGVGLVRIAGAGSSAGVEATPPAVGPSMIGVPYEGFRTVRVGIIGVGGRGTGLLGDLLAIPDVQVKAICDIVRDKVLNAQRMVVRAGQPIPEGYWASETDYENLCKRDDLDLIYIATPWDWHVPMAVSGMLCGKHVGVEVPAATTVKDCWKLVDTSEKTRKHCVMLENVCYGYSEMMVLNMVRAGLFGELTHGEAAYIHDLRGLLFSGGGEALWRREAHTKRNGNLYPTHGLGPVAQYMGVNRGDKFDVLVSLSSPEKGFTLWQQTRLASDDPRRKEKYVCGDMNTSIIRTALGRTIMLQHDTVSPRPYDRINLISGTKGTFRGFPDRIFIDGQPDHDWQSLDPFRERYEHPLWKKEGEMARKLGGHGGMDYIMSFRLIECMKEGLVPDMDVYDAAAWSVPGPLSEESNRKGGMPVKFPDFTRGRWKERKG